MGVSFKTREYLQKKTAQMIAFYYFKEIIVSSLDLIKTQR